MSHAYATFNLWRNRWLNSRLQFCCGKIYFEKLNEKGDSAIYFYLQRSINEIFISDRSEAIILIVLSRKVY